MRGRRGAEGREETVVALGRRGRRTVGEVWMEEGGRAGGKEATRWGKLSVWWGEKGREGLEE